jgi:hypothetical protein
MNNLTQLVSLVRQVFEAAKDVGRDLEERYERDLGAADALELALDALETTVEELEEAVEAREHKETSDILERQREASRIEFELEQERRRLDSVERDLERIEDRLEDREQLEASLQPSLVEAQRQRLSASIEVYALAHERYPTHLRELVDAELLTSDDLYYPAGLEGWSYEPDGESFRLRHRAVAAATEDDPDAETTDGSEDREETSPDDEETSEDEEPSDEQ